MPERDRARVPALDMLDLMGTSRDPDFGCMVALARSAFDAPVALITLVDGNRLWFKAQDGADCLASELTEAFYQDTIAAGGLFMVEDASSDSRFRDNRLVTRDPRLRFYAGMPIALEPGLTVGTLCVFDTRPRHFTHEQEELLARITDVLAAMIRQRRDARAVTRMAGVLQEQALLLAEQAASLAHGKKIFERASAVVKIGAWECDLRDESLQWTGGVYDIFELPRNSPITRAQILEFYSQESLNQLQVLRTRAIQERGGFSFDARVKTAKGNSRWMRLTATVECESDVPVRIFGLKQDITEEKALWDRTRYLAEFDTLTGLANRSLFQARLADPRDTEAEPVGALLLLDLDGFKQVNDTFGHALGDECLKQIAERLRHVCHDAQLVARIGGDEFAVLIGPGFDRQAIEAHAERILEELRQPIQWREQSFQLGASIGIAMLEAAAPRDRAELFTEADLALYAAKAAGRNTFRVFTPAMKSKAERRFETVRNLAAALAEDQLELFYQPKIRLQDGRLSGFEALLRWRIPGGQVVAAGAFQAAFEDPELSSRLGHWVIDGALHQAQLWNRSGYDFGHIAVNLSSSQFRDHRFADRLIARVAAHGLRPDMIEVEVTEGVFLSPETDRVRNMLRHLKSSGIRVALDDFGTGYASLVHLRNAPIDIIKIDKSFVQRFLSSPQDRAILEATLGLGLRLGMDIVAEGIETSGQFERLKALGCQIGQGFLFSKPLPASEAARWHRPATAAVVTSVSDPAAIDLALA